MSDTEQRRVRTLAEVRGDRPLLRDSLARIADAAERIVEELRADREQWERWRQGIAEMLADAKAASDAKQAES
jgi:hypothetical protein